MKDQNSDRDNEECFSVSNPLVKKPKRGIDMKTNEEMNTMKTGAEIPNPKIYSLNEDESALVMGGRKEDYITKLECPCGYDTDWYGYFIGEVFDCPQCGNHTLKGVRKNK